MFLRGNHAPIQRRCAAPASPIFWRTPTYAHRGTTTKFLHDFRTIQEESFAWSTMPLILAKKIGTRMLSLDQFAVADRLHQSFLHHAVLLLFFLLKSFF